MVDNRFDALLHVTNITKDLATAQDEYVKACAELKAARKHGFDLKASYKDYQRLLKVVTERHNAVGALETKLINTVFEFSLYLKRD